MINAKDRIHALPSPGHIRKSLTQQEMPNGTRPKGGGWVCRLGRVNQMDFQMSKFRDSSEREAVN